MTKFVKIIITLIFMIFWGQLQRGCQEGARSTGSGLGYALLNIFGLITLFAGLYGIWKYEPQKDVDSDNQSLDKS
jgi:hypothetical protein